MNLQQCDIIAQPGTRPHNKNCCFYINKHIFQIAKLLFQVGYVSWLMQTTHETIKKETYLRLFG